MPKKPTDPIQAYDDKGRPIFGWDDKGVPVCFSKKAGKPEHNRCMSTARMANGRCSRHGGPTPCGINSASFKHGAFMKNLPQRVAADLAEIAKDKDYLSLKPEMDMNTVHILELMREFQQGFDEHTYEIIMSYADKLHLMVNSGKINKLFEAMGAGDLPEAKNIKEISEKLAYYIKKGADQKRLHREIAVVAEQRRKLAETEIKRIALERNHLPLDQALTIYGLIMLSIQKHCKDPVALRAISSDVDGIVILRQIQARTHQVDIATLERKGKEAREAGELGNLEMPSLEAPKASKIITEKPLKKQPDDDLFPEKDVDPEKRARQKALIESLGLDYDEDDV